MVRREARIEDAEDTVRYRMQEIELEILDEIFDRDLAYRYRSILRQYAHEVEDEDDY